MQLRIPGPTPLPEPVREAGSAEMVSHRGPEFRALMREVTENLQRCFQTENDLLVFPAAGTGGLEAAIANLFSPGDRLISVTTGAFGDRFAEIATRFGLNVITVASEWGKPADLPGLIAALEETPHCRGVLATHNETSTGVQNDIQGISRIIEACASASGSESSTPLLVVDAISSMGAVDIPVDAWGIDVAITASQKAWMAAPGLTMLSVSERAWRAKETATLPCFYWDFTEARRFLRRWETPYTPAVSLLYGLRAALRLILDEGLPQVFARHELIRDLVRSRARDISLAPFAADQAASRTVTALCPPHGVPAREIVSAMRQQNVVIASGQGAYEDRIIRIGHMGMVSTEDIEEVMSVLDHVLSSQLSLLSSSSMSGA